MSSDVESWADHQVAFQSSTDLSPGRSLEVLASLRNACADCESIIEAAVAVVESPLLRTRLIQHQEAWAQLSEMMAIMIREAGSPIEDRSAAAATLHRAWVKIKSAIADERAIANECLRREMIVRKKLEAALERDLPAPIRSQLGAALERVLWLGERSQSCVNSDRAVRAHTSIVKRSFIKEI